jgi:hypothetical protein
VCGHAQYRKLMVREVSFTHLLRNIGSRLSLCFFGCSLSDQDLLSSLDDIKENLGGEIGPHFWLTADNVHPKRRLYLQRHYSIHVIGMPGKFVSGFAKKVVLLTFFFIFVSQAQFQDARSVPRASLAQRLVSAHCCG